MSSKYYVIFKNDSHRWWSFMLKKDCRHCFIVKTDRNCLIIFGKDTTKFDLFTVSNEKSIIEGIYAMKSVTPKEYKRSLCMLNTCVGHTKQILGINKPFIWRRYDII